MLCTNLPFSFVAAIAGTISGLLYRIEFLRLNQLHLLLPRFAVNLATKYIYPHVNPAPTAIRRRRRQQQQQQQQDAQQIQQLLGDNSNTGGETRQRSTQAQGYADNLLGAPNNANASAFWNALLQYQQQQLQQRGQQQPQQQQAQVQEVVDDEEPSEANISMLTDMGYSREEALHALRLSNNNVHQAADILLGER